MTLCKSEDNLRNTRGSVAMKLNLDFEFKQSITKLQQQENDQSSMNNGSFFGDLTQRSEFQEKEDMES